MPDRRFTVSYVLGDGVERDDGSFDLPRDALLHRDGLAKDLAGHLHKCVRVLDTERVDVDCTGEVDWSDVCPACGVLWIEEERCPGCAGTWQEVEAATIGEAGVR